MNDNLPEPRGLPILSFGHKPLSDHTRYHAETEIRRKKSKPPQKNNTSQGKTAPCVVTVPPRTDTQHTNHHSVGGAEDRCANSAVVNIVETIEYYIYCVVFIIVKIL